MSRKIEDLTPRTRLKYEMFEWMMKDASHPFMITSTYRSQDEQDAIYKQGRTTPGPIVTWTRTSRHTGRDAFDIAILKQGKPVWDTKADVDADSVPDYQEAGEIGEKCGLVWGGRFKNSKGEPRPDYPHFQDNGKDLEEG
jgi:peptidoglycan L-alanyl-D-glutamate endopeptidase CwlK